MTPDDLARKNRRILVVTFAVVLGMIALAYISVPLYRMLCQVTGWGGTTQMVKVNPNKDNVLTRKITVRFNTNTARNMPWTFKPDLPSVDVRVGQDGLISFRAVNPTSQTITGTAIYNVTPLQAGKYFYKTQCFCFDEQVLNPGQTVHMPVSFFIDPKIMDDPEMDDLTTSTLSYTFFKKDSAELEKAMETFYNTGNDSNKPKE